MKPFITHSGLVMPMDKVNVDTDQMVPKQFLKALTRQGFGRILFYDWRYLPGEKPNPDFVLNFPRYKGASVLLARANFGCRLQPRTRCPGALPIMDSAPSSRPAMPTSSTTTASRTAYSPPS